REERRRKELSDYHTLDTKEEEEFNNLATLAAQICDVPIAQINFVDGGRTWSKAAHGALQGKSVTEYFCKHTIAEDLGLIIPDTANHSHFKTNPYVTGEPGVRFYAGFNIKSDDTYNLGTLCVVDTKPRKLTEAQINALKILAKEVEARLELRKTKQEQKTITSFLESSVDMMLIVDSYSKRIFRYSEKVADFFELEGQACDLFLHDVFPDESFQKSVLTWDAQGAHGKVKPLANIINGKGEDCFFEVTVSKQHGKWFMAARNVSDEIVYQNRLEKILYEKSVLLSEVHHRVKNNLAVISSILQLEELKSESIEVQQALYQNYMRIKSMSLIHDEMYKQSDFTGVQFDVYLDSFAVSLKNDKRTQTKSIAIQTSVQPVVLNLNQAVPCALIINELVSNAFEFAFEGLEAGCIRIGLEQKGRFVTLIVEDNGIGLPENFDLASSPTLANTLVYSYSEQLDSKIEVKSEGGASFRITFKRNDKASGSSANNHFSLAG
ncbi:MAG: hypothetical protein MI700_02735, partial [Balneolales bacterium]|nr:hypothetical protein [Balneolales bacterium]